MKHLVTSALPYANGPIHFGHIAGVYLPADIYCRHKKLKGSKVMHICGSDEHGVAIMQNAQKKKESYQEYVNFWHKEHKSVFDLYQIQFDFFGQTSAKYHAQEVTDWFHDLNAKGFIEKKAENQLQCQDCHNYLPDRYVEGTCYKCGHTEARGDECPSCGEWIDAVRLIDPVCKFCDSKNIEVKSVDQWYLMLSKYHKEFRKWFEGKESTWRKTVYSFVDSLTKEKMVDRAITRDLDWGIDVPLDEAKGKKLYVWFDAPIGYVSNTKEFLKKSGEDYLKDWWQGPDVKITNFVGKDNIIFHAIIFPMMCLASGRTKAVDDLAANQYVNLGGKQFSKSKGHYVDAKEALNEFGPDALRYYLTSLIPETVDTSFTWSGLEAKINNELANNIGNFISRSISFFHKNWADGIEPAHFMKFFSSPEWAKIEEHTQSFHKTMDAIQLRRSLEQVMHLGQSANTFFSDQAPWAQIKEDENKAKETIAFSAIYGFYLGVFLEAFLPNLSANILKLYPEIPEAVKKSAYMGDKDRVMEYFSKNNKVVGKPSPLVPKIDQDRIKELEAQLAAK